MDLLDLKNKALENNIPIMQDEGLAFMTKLLDECQASSVLEIGAAVGYSAIYMASHVENLCIDTIERDVVREKEARANIANFQLEKQITLHYADALELDISLLKHAPYDCIFIDAAKAQYQKFFERYIHLLKDDGFVIVDNLDFHGMIFDIPHIHNRNTRALVRKIKRFKDWILNNEDYESEYVQKGDGIVVIRKRKKHEASM